MAQFYTLEEAARVLGMNPEELKAKAQQREVRAFLDGGSWRFRVVDVDELARRRGMGSDAELRLSDLDLPTTSRQGDSVSDLDLSEFALGVANPDLGAPTMDVPHPEAGSDHDILLDDISLPPNPMTKSSSVIIGMGPTGKLPTDSDVRLVPDNPRGIRPSDSDVRLASPGDFKPPSDSDVTLIAEDTSAHPKLSPGDTAVRQGPMIGSSAEVAAAKGDDMDSDFELTPSSVIDALQPDSGSDFELSALEEPSDEFESTPMVKPSDSDVTAADPGFSGINLSRPSDSGINLQMATGLNLGGAGASSIELTPLSDDEMKATAPPPKPKPAVKPSLAATPPPSAAAKKPEKDIFDDTDFEVDALDSDADSDDKTVQLEAASDFELEEASDETGSEVFAIDEEDVDHNAATAMGPAVLEEEEDDGFEEATTGEMSSAWDVESESETPSSAGRAAASPAMLATASAASAEWGGIWVGLLGVATVLMLFLAFVSLDLVRNLYDYQSATPASGIVKSLAGLIAEK